MFDLNNVLHTANSNIRVDEILANFHVRGSVFQPIGVSIGENDFT